MGNRFVNPYTFVGMRDEKSKCTVSPQDKTLTGKITCRMITKTQLAVPDVVNGQTPEGINKHPFFRVGGKAVVPGSGIRGVIRNVYETLTNSCLHVNDKDDDYFSSRQNKLHAGLIAFENNSFVLYEAERLRAMTFDKEAETRPKTGDKVSYTYEAKESGDRSLYNMAKNVCLNENGGGVFLKVDLFSNTRKDRVTGQKIPTQNHSSVFVKGNKKANLSKQEIKAFEENIKRYEPKKDKKAAENYSKCFKAMKKGTALLPVWYCTKNGHFYLAQSQFSRTVFISKPKDMLDKMKYSACTVKSNMCEACALFGMVGLGKEGEAASSRVRFGDAVCDDKNCFDKYYVLPVLGSPRLSSFEFYLKTRNGHYKTEKDRDETVICAIDPDEQNTVIAGRKFYWHHSGKTITANDKKAVSIAAEAREQGKTTFSSKDNCLELVKPDTTFSFEVFFDGITKEQLKKLVFSLNFGENSEQGTLCHKIGHGKPVGLGSVKIVVDDLVIREYSDSKYTVTDNKRDDYTAKAEELFNISDYEQILKAVNMKTIPDGSLISYPKTSSSEDAFKWFAKNRKTLRSGEGMAKMYHRLPDIGNDDQTLPVFEEFQNYRPQNNTGFKQGGNNSKNKGKYYAADNPHKKY